MCSINKNWKCCTTRAEEFVQAQFTFGGIFQLQLFTGTISSRAGAFNDHAVAGKLG